MLTILKTSDPAERRSICADAGLAETDDLTVYVAKSGGERLGYAVYASRDEACEIYAVEAGGDPPLFDGLVRSVLFAETENGADKPARFDQRIDRTLLIRYGFLQDGADCLKSMADFLDRCKNCENG